MFGLTPREEKLLRRLDTPIKIQNYLNKLPWNFEVEEPSHMSTRRALRARRANCIEGALIGATALWLLGEKPLIMDMRAAPNDDDHVIALYKRGKYWGAISKTNHATIRFRDPVYKTPRELAMSYFHEWFLNTTGEKTLVDYAGPYDLSKLGTDWITSEKHLWYLDKKLGALPHYQLLPKGHKKYLRTADALELRAGRIVEWKKPIGR